MDNKYEIIDIEKWSRKAEYEYFSRGGCNFNVTSQIDVTNIYELAKKCDIKFSSLLLSITIIAANCFPQFKYGYIDNKLVCYETVHPIFYELNKDLNAMSLFAEYTKSISTMAKRIEEERTSFANLATYCPEILPNNGIMISILPWEDITSISFDLQYGYAFLAPIIAYGKYKKIGNRISLPFSIFVNHKVVDGYNVAMLIRKIRELIENLTEADIT